MKKMYVSPMTELVEVNIESLLSVDSIHNTEAGKGSDGNGVNFSRESDWED